MLCIHARVLWHRGFFLFLKPLISTVRKHSEALLGQWSMLLKNIFTSCHDFRMYKNRQWHPSPWRRNSQKMSNVIHAMVRMARSLFLLLFFFSSSWPVASVKNITSSLLSISRWSSWSATLLKPMMSWETEGNKERRDDENFHCQSTTQTEY